MVTDRVERTGVVLNTGESGASVLRSLLEGARVAFAEDFAGFTLPSDDAAFKARFAELIPQFEALRVVSPRRAEIARALCIEAGARLSFVDERGQRALSEALREDAAPLPLVRVDLPGAGLLSPCVDFRGHMYEGPHIAELANELLAAHLVTRPLAEALSLAARNAQAPGGLSLKGERFVLIGAGAELSPIYTLLEAGAEVLWIDVRNPPIDHLLEPRLGGVLHYVDGGVDVLARPNEVRATIENFAAGGPVHLSLLAFAGGGARELRLDFMMLELVRALPIQLLASVALLLSPTSASPVHPDDAAVAEERQKSASTVQRALLRTGPLSPGSLQAGEGRISCAVVSQQGASYQAAEYIGKRLAAEALFEFGSKLNDQPGTLAVSVSMAPITATQSLASPLLEAAVVGAPSVEILIAQPSTARAIAGLLTVHDLADAARALRELARLPQEERLRALFARQFHGGVHAQPYGLEGLIRMAALRGITQRPKLAFEFLR